MVGDGAGDGGGYDDPRTRLRPSTRSVHAGEPRVRTDRSLTPPIVHCSSFPFADTAELVAYMQGELERPAEYGRYGNPTVLATEAKLAALEGAEAAVSMATGMAAVTTTLLALCRTGHHVVMTNDVYRKTRQFAAQVLRRFGVEISVVEPELSALAAAIRSDTRVIYTEAPTNPYLRLIDLAGLAELARAHRCKTIVDATFATPLNMQPLAHGIDLVIHSATKYLAGHNDVMGGVVAGSRALTDAIREQLWMLGAVLDPHSAYLIARGLKTLGLRIARQNASSMHLANVLEAHPAVQRVFYPGLPSHPDHALAARYLAGGGGVVSFEVEGGLAAGTTLVDAVRIPKLAPSLGGVESLIEQPALMSFFELGPDERAQLGIREGLVRLSVGIEDVEDLEADLRRGLDRLREK